MILATRAFALFPALILAALFGTGVPHAAAAEKPHVSVNWTDPSQFSEMKNRSAMRQSNPEAWLSDFASTIRRRANKVLKTGQSLSVTITDVTLAGTTRSGPAAGGVRVVGKNSPPQIKLHFTLTGVDGKVISSGDRDLSDPSVMSASLPGNTDPYPYEEKLLRNWMDTEFGKQDK